MIVGPLMLWLTAAVAIAGFCVVALGLRPRVIAHHPTCRRCRFDLSGVELQPIGDALARCPECGSDLCGKNAIRPKLTRRRPITLAFGILLLFVAVSSVIHQNRTPIAGWLQRHKPVAWLLADLGSEHRPRLDAAAAELFRRTEDGWEPSEAQVAAITDAILARQADPTRIWSLAAGTLIESLHRLDRIDERRMRSYFANAFNVTLAVPPRVRANGVANATFIVTPVRCGRSFPAVAIRCERLEVNGVVLVRDSDLLTFKPSQGTSQRTSCSSPLSLTPGSATIRAVVTLHVRTHQGTAPAFQRYELEREFELVGPDVVLVAVRESAELDAAVRSAFRSVTARVQVSKDQRTEVRVDLVIAHSPIHLFQRVIATSTDAAGKLRSTDLGAIIVHPNLGAQTLSVGGTLNGPITGPLSVLFIPDVPTAERAVGIETIFGGVIDFGQVPTIIVEDLWKEERQRMVPSSR